MEVVKTRMQLQGELNLTGAKQYRGVFHAFSEILRKEGLRGAQRGLKASYLAQLVQNGSRLGLYSNLKQLVGADDPTASFFFFRTLVAGASAGVASAAAGSPFEMVKTRFQAQSPVLQLNNQFQYTSLSGAFLSVFRTEGVSGLFRGVTAAMWRTGVGSAVQLSTFDTLKRFFVERGLTPQDTLVTDFCASAISGVLVTTAMNPFDVVRTRLWNQKTTAAEQMYRGPLDCLVKTARAEGVQGLFKGWLPHYLRLGPHTMLVLIFFGQLKRAADSAFPRS
eukprot:TRINITY_DN11870_c0_g1_i1.p1 TRINITY_DN11870_c0_g1~~TRINITY_DN11870_c0_g1_i1.p1  ORF type:complete len:279 (+),score=47.18 TRINITY_DN11870_c0_g1_i1:250-1086(+)